MTITDGTNIDRVRRDAFDHCIFPLARVEDVHRDGPNIYVEGRGVELVDQSGRVYLDMMSSHTRANSLGYGNDEIARAVYEQLGRLHYVGTYDNFVAAGGGAGSQDRVARAGRAVACDVCERRLGGGRSRAQARQAVSDCERPKAARVQGHCPVERVSWRDDGGDFGHRLARHAPHLRAGRAGDVADPRPDALPQPVRHARR